MPRNLINHSSYTGNESCKFQYKTVDGVKSVFGVFLYLLGLLVSGGSEHLACRGRHFDQDVALGSFVSLVKYLYFLLEVTNVLAALEAWDLGKQMRHGS